MTVTNGLDFIMTSQLTKGIQKSTELRIKIVLNKSNRSGVVMDVMASSLIGVFFTRFAHITQDRKPYHKMWRSHLSSLLHYISLICRCTYSLKLFSTGKGCKRDGEKICSHKGPKEKKQTIINEKDTVLQIVTFKEFGVNNTITEDLEIEFCLMRIFGSC